MKKIIDEKLQLFAEGAEAAAEGAEGGAENVNNTEVNAEPENEINNTEVSGNEEKEDSFDSLIKGKYKADFENALNASLSEKDTEIEDLHKQIEKLNSVFDALAAKHGKKSGDIEGILKAVSDDESYYEEAAAREGLTIEQYKEMQELRKVQEEREAIRRAEMARSQAQKDLAEWFKQGEALKGVYKDFDLRNELGNRDFVGLLKNGIPVKMAYELMHMDEIIAGAAKISAKNAEKNTIAKIQQKASRPVENGTNSQTGAIINAKYSNLSREERADLARRAQKGELIKF